MALFGGNKRKKLEEARRKAAEKRRRELEAIIYRKRAGVALPGKGEIEKYPAEYKQFLEEVKARPMGLYERAAALAERILPIKVPKDFGGIESSAQVGYLAATPSGVTALTILTGAVLLAVTIGLATILPNCVALPDPNLASTCTLATGAPGMLASNGSLLLFMLIMTALAVYLVWNYPTGNARSVTMRMSSDSVLAILYMVVYMRTSPNLEGALRFASETLTGPLSWDLKKLLWDIHVGVYSNADSALAAYGRRWKKENEEFAEAINLLRSSAAVEARRRGKLFDETVDLILRGTAEKTKKYVTDLRMPVMLIHALGILLPVMGLVLFPVVVIFMSDVITPGLLFLGYDVLLPIFLWFVISHVLMARPPTFSQPDVSLAKDVPPLGHLRVGRGLVPIWPIALAVLLPILIYALIHVGPCFAPAPDMAAQCSADSFVLVNLSLLIVIALGLSISLYTLLDSSQKMKVRSDIESIEEEFGVALFQLGSSVTGGTPIELAIDKAAENLKGMKIADLFTRTSSNMRRFGYTFEQALFDPVTGSVWWYPSRLVRSIMTTVSEASKKGMYAASDAMVTISTYLKGMHAVKDQVEEVLGETIASLKFLSMLLTPLVAGVTITMAVVIIEILTSLGSQLANLGASEVGVPGVPAWSWLNSGGTAITPAAFQLIVGLYMLEVSLLLAYFLNRIQFGEDAIGLRSVIGKTLIISVLVYAASWLFTYMIFGGAIHNLLVPITPTSGVPVT